MSYFRASDKLHSNAKVIAAQNEAVGAWVRMGSWSADELTDGFVPEAVAMAFAGKKSVIERLVAVPHGKAVGLLERVKGGYRVHDFLAHNPPAAKVLQDRAAWRESQDRSRGSRKGSWGDTRVSSPGLSPNDSGLSPGDTPHDSPVVSPVESRPCHADPGSKDPDPEIPPPKGVPPVESAMTPAVTAPPDPPPSGPQIRTDPGFWTFETSVFATGFETATGRRLHIPHGREEAALIQALALECPPDLGPEERVRWARAEGEAFGRGANGRPKVNGWTYGEWLNGGRQDMAPARSGRGRFAPKQPAPADAPWLKS